MQVVESGRKREHSSRRGLDEFPSVTFASVLHLLPVKPMANRLSESEFFNAISFAVIANAYDVSATESAASSNS